MIPEAGKNYHIHFTDPDCPKDTHYVGSGIYTGDKDCSGYYIFDLPIDEPGSFTESCIKHEVKLGEKIKKKKESMEEITIKKAEYEKLKDHSAMLGIIAAYVQEFCEEEEDNTLIGVMNLVRNYCDLKSDQISESIEAQRRNRNKTS